MQHDDGHIELKPRVIGDMMGKIPTGLGWVALSFFSIILVMLVYFALGFRVEDAMQVRGRVHHTGNPLTYSITAVISKNQAGKVRKGNEVILNMPALPGIIKKQETGRIVSIDPRSDDTYVAVIALNDHQDYLKQYMQQRRTEHITCEIITGRQSVLSFFLSN